MGRPGSAWKGWLRRCVVQQRQLRRVGAEGAAAEDAHDAVLAVVAGFGLHLSPAHAVDALRQRLAAGCCDRLNRRLAQNGQLRPQFAEQFPVLLLHATRGLAHFIQLGEQLRQRNQAEVGMRAGGAPPFGAVGEPLDAVKHADGHLFAADGAEAAMRQRRLRMPAHAALAMAVDMIFAFFGEELDRALKGRRVAALHGFKEGVIGKLAVEERRLARQLLRRVGV